MALWLWRGPGDVVRLLEDYDNTFYVQALEGDYQELERLCTETGAPCERVEAKLELGRDQETEVLKVHLGLRDERSFVRALNQRGGFGRYRFFGLDPDLEQRFLQSRGLYPLARVSCYRHRYETLGSRRGMIQPPPLQVAELTVEPCMAASAPHLLDPLARLELFRLPSPGLAGDGTGRFSEGRAPIGRSTTRVGSKADRWEWLAPERGSRKRGPTTPAESEALEQLQEVLDDWGVDVVVTCGGDQFDLGYLWARADLAGLRTFRLGRQWQPPRPRRGASSYTTYGEVRYQAPAWHLHGRLHIDARNSFFFQEGGVSGLIHLARLSGVPLQTLARSMPGTAISTIQIHEAARRGYPVLWKKNHPEQPKTMAELACADRGGYICDPQVGVHENVAEVDFISLYPSIMVKYNISPESLDCPCCPGSKLAIRGLPYHFCQRQEGIVPTSLRSLLATRRVCKALSHSSDDHYKKVADVLKWLLVCSFGYQGYRNARYGRIECHEAIQAAARETMVTSIELAEEAGYRVLHGIVDSLWLQGPRKGLPALVGRISKATGLFLALEALYRWIVFLPNRTTGQGSLTHYYGLKVTGQVKYRGIELRQHDTPAYHQRAQQALLAALARAGTVADFHQRIPEAVAVLRDHAGPLRRGEVDPRELLMRRRLTRSLEAYHNFTDNSAAQEQLLEAGIEARPGQRVRYLVANTRGRTHLERVRIEQLMRGDETYDRAYYYKTLLRCGESLLLPFGWDVGRLDAAVRT